MAEFETIAQLPSGPTILSGLELLEIQNGTGVGASQQTTVGHILALSLKNLVRTTVKTANYTLSPSDLAVFDTTAASYTALLPNAPVDGTVCAVKMVVQGGTNTVTWETQGSDTIDTVGGMTSGTLILPGQAAIVVYQASTKVWSKISDDYSLASLDGRYDASGAAATAQSNAEAYTDSNTGQVLGINSQTTAYTLLLSDKGKDVQINSSTPVNLTVPLHSEVPFPLGTMVPFSQLGLGVVTAIGASGVTVEGLYGVSTAGILDGRVLESIAVDIWRVW